MKRYMITVVELESAVEQLQQANFEVQREFEGLNVVIGTTPDHNVDNVKKLACVESMDQLRD